jgi:hypothetical protein
MTTEQKLIIKKVSTILSILSGLYGIFIFFTKYGYDGMFFGLFLIFGVPAILIGGANFIIKGDKKENN